MMTVWVCLLALTVAWIWRLAQVSMARQQDLPVAQPRVDRAGPHHRHRRGYLPDH
jgi:hypothetical protein